MGHKENRGLLLAANALKIINHYPNVIDEQDISHMLVIC